MLREQARLKRQLAELPRRRLWPLQRQRLQTQFANRLRRVQRALGLRVPRPPVKPEYRIGEAAALVGVSKKTLGRWTQAGRLPCRVAWNGTRHYAHADFLQLLRTVKV